MTADEAIRAGTTDVLPEYTFTRKDAGAAIAASSHSLLDSFSSADKILDLEGQVSMALPDEKGGMVLTVQPSTLRRCSSALPTCCMWQMAR